MQPLPPNSLVDTHTHTFFSDGADTFEDNARAAEASGCRVLVCTDHLTLPHAMDPKSAVQVIADELPAHRAAFERARQEHPGLEMLYGFECDWYEGCEENVMRWSQGAQVRLGSVHWIGTQCDGGWIDDPADQRLWHELGPDEVWRRYTEAWCAACASDLPFDTMPHPDLPMRFSMSGMSPTIDLAPLWDRMVEAARAGKRRVELSTAGWRKGIESYYPVAGLLVRFCQAGVPITVGSDAHTAHDICWGIRDAYAHAWRCGYRAIEVPRIDGSWEAMSITL